MPNVDDEGDNSSQQSISLSSPAYSPRSSFAIASRFSYESTDSPKVDVHNLYSSESTGDATLISATSAYSTNTPFSTTTYPPPPIQSVMGDTESIKSAATTSSYSKKARPESMLVALPDGPLVLGIALVDFNHLVGPKIEFCRGDIFEDEEISKILPFLALPDGAHLTTEDYTYFHLVPSSPNPSTIFGISCNRQIAASALLVKDIDVTRSIVQKAVVVLASKPVFGPIRDRLGVVTLALFEQKNFMELDILDEFYSSLDLSLKGQLTASGLYMGTSLRDLVHTFRQRTLILLKALMLQKRIMFYGHPVERLCTYQYSLISLMPGLLQHLEDCGSPPLASRAPVLSRPTSLKTSDNKSMMAYLGLPLDLFGLDAFFQPYLPLQQLDMTKESRSWLCGCTNSIVIEQNEIDLLVNIETGTVEFRDVKLERSAGLTAADRKWMDDIVRDVNVGWQDDDTRAVVQFKGSDDYLRTKFEEYISGALSSIKYADFVGKGQQSGVVISDGSGGDPNSIHAFNPLWISEFKRTNAYEVWDRIADPLIFDIVEPRHPCNTKLSVVEDIGLRLQEGIQDLKLEQQLAPTREALSKTLATGSTNFFKAVEGVRGRFLQRGASHGSTIDSSTRPNSPEVSQSDAKSVAVESYQSSPVSSPQLAPRQLTLVSSQTAADAKVMLGSWGSGVGSFFSSRASRFSLGSITAPEPKPTTPVEARNPPPLPRRREPYAETNVQPRDLLNADRASTTDGTELTPTETRILPPLPRRREPHMGTTTQDLDADRYLATEETGLAPVEVEFPPPLPRRREMYTDTDVQPGNPSGGRLITAEETGLAM